ncbi:MAG: GIY-YIG nuclease family protein [Candidatus Marinimicrobia bacterium]|nr:GIY-YIG nuclease family protein [Candidatus Neomarinimicrobiota bacterium]
MSHFVYILKSKIADWHYIGMSKNPIERLKSHNSGKVRSTNQRDHLKSFLQNHFQTGLQLDKERNIIKRDLVEKFG